MLKSVLVFGLILAAAAAMDQNSTGPNNDHLPALTTTALESVCYANRYADLKKAFCRPDCNTNLLHVHFERYGLHEGRHFGCGEKMNMTNVQSTLAAATEPTEPNLETRTSKPHAEPRLGPPSSLIAAVCITGLFRTANHVLPHLRRQYPPHLFVSFVVTDTDATGGATDRRAALIHSELKPEAMVFLDPKESSQVAGLKRCEGLIKAYEAKRSRSFVWIARQRIDTLGCTVSWPEVSSWPLRKNTILVSHGKCGSIADNWGFMSRDVLDAYASSAYWPSPEKHLGEKLTANNVSIWIDGGPVCFKIVRTKYSKWGPSVYQTLDTAEALAESVKASIRPVSFKKQVC